jgi:signal transduction histidine kinase
MRALGGSENIGLVPSGIALSLAAVLVVAAGLASFDGTRGRWHADARPATPSLSHLAPVDPGIVSVERWRIKSPGVAGVAAAAWCGARAGAAGLLVDLGWEIAGWPHRTWVLGTAVAFLAALQLVPLARRAAHLSYWAVGLVGIVITVGGLVAVAEGRLHLELVPSGPLWPSAWAHGAPLESAATDIATLCMLSVALLAVRPVMPRAELGARQAVTAMTVVPTCCWALAVPPLVRAGIPGGERFTITGGPGSLTSSVQGLVAPLVGGQAANATRWGLVVACVAGGLGLLWDATSLATWTFRAPRVANANGQWTVTDGKAIPAGHHGPKHLGLNFPAAAQGAVISALLGAIAAGLGPSHQLLSVFGAAATTALALTAMSPSPARSHDGSLKTTRALAAVISIAVLILVLGSRGSAALGVAGAAGLFGALVMAQASFSGCAGSWRDSLRLLLPPEVLGTGVVALSAAAALEAATPAVTGSGLDPLHIMAAVMVVLGVLAVGALPVASQLWAGRTRNAAFLLAEHALPALAVMAESLTDETSERPAAPGLAALDACLMSMKVEPRPPKQLRPMVASLDKAGRQARRLANAIEAAIRLEGRRLEELVDERMSALASANRNLAGASWHRRQLLDRVMRATEAERARLAADLHDGPVQRLATLGLALDRCMLRLDRGDTAGGAVLAQRARAELSEEIARLRRMMTELRPPVLDEHGLDSALRDLVSGWSEATAVPARFEPSPHEEINPEAETVAYRVVQEALTNVAKHAKAGLATITIGPSDDGIEVVVSDNGKGFDSLAQPDRVREGHFGLMVMRERVELASGRFELWSAPLMGTRVKLWLPGSAHEPLSEAEGLARLLEVINRREENTSNGAAQSVGGLHRSAVLGGRSG